MDDYRRPGALTLVVSPPKILVTIAVSALDDAAKLHDADLAACHSTKSKPPLDHPQLPVRRMGEETTEIPAPGKTVIGVCGHGDPRGRFTSRIALLYIWNARGGICRDWYCPGQQGSWRERKSKFDEKMIPVQPVQ